MYADSSLPSKAELLTLEVPKFMTPDVWNKVMDYTAPSPIVSNVIVDTLKDFYAKLRVQAAEYGGALEAL